MVYDITDPKNPLFITYYTNRTVESGNISGDVAPEIIRFIHASESPNGQNLLLVGYEVSGSMAIIQIGGELLTISEQAKASAFKIYPNPVSGGTLMFSKSMTGEVLNTSGQVILTFENANSINTKELPDGMYILKTEEGTQRFMVFN